MELATGLFLAAVGVFLALVAVVFFLFQRVIVLEKKFFDLAAIPANVHYVPPPVVMPPVQSPDTPAEYDLVGAWAYEMEQAGLAVTSSEISRQRALRMEAGL